MSLEEAALVEPTAVAIHACRRAGVSLGKVLTYIILTYNIKLNLIERIQFNMYEYYILQPHIVCAHLRSRTHWYVESYHG